MHRNRLPKHKEWQAGWIKKPGETFKETAGRMGQERTRKWHSFLTDDSSFSCFMARTGPNSLRKLTELLLPSLPWSSWVTSSHRFIDKRLLKERVFVSRSYWRLGVAGRGVSWVLAQFIIVTSDPLLCWGAICMATVITRASPPRPFNQACVTSPPTAEEVKGYRKVTNCEGVFVPF
jgi:hypothetical protein